MERNPQEAEIARQTLERYSGCESSQFHSNLILTNFPRYVDYFGTIGTGVRPNAQRVTKTALEMMPVPLPPMDEQIAIRSVNK